MSLMVAPDEENSSVPRVECDRESARAALLHDLDKPSAALLRSGLRSDPVFC
jgi:hypothetical protein